MKRYGPLIMLGAAPETRGSIATVVATYRGHGLFTRWPIRYIATHGAGSAAQRAPFALKAAGRFAALLAGHRRAVLHIHTAAGRGFWRDSAYIAAAIAARWAVIVHLHGGGFDSFYDACSPSGKALIRHLLEKAACVAAPSQRLVSWLGAVSPGARSLFLPNPVPIPQLEDSPRPNLIVFLGKLEAQRGIFDLLEAVARLRSAVPDVRLVCAGEGERVAVARHAERLGIADAVKFTGWIGPSGKRALLESAAVFALPSYCEGMPMGLLEAMAAGTPVVASPVGGIAEVVVDGVSGLLAAPGDIATLQRLLRALLLEREFGARIGMAGRETARLRFSPERALPKLEAIYAQLGLQPLDHGARPLESGLRIAT